MLPPSIFWYRTQSVWRWAMGWTIGVLGLNSRRGLGILLFTTASRTALGPTHPPIQWVPGALSLGVKRPGREPDHSLPSAEVKECVELYLHSPKTSSWRGGKLSTGTLPLPLPLPSITSLHSDIIQKAATWSFIALKTSSPNTGPIELCDKWLS
jgi:hypothetical protein